MSPILKLWLVFWHACKETPRGMYLPLGAFIAAASQSREGNLVQRIYAPFVAFWQTATHNPVLEKSISR